MASSLFPFRSHLRSHLLSGAPWATKTKVLATPLTPTPNLQQLSLTLSCFPVLLLTLQVYLHHLLFTVCWLFSSPSLCSSPIEVPSKRMCLVRSSPSASERYPVEVSWQSLTIFPQAPSAFQQKPNKFHSWETYFQFTTDFSTRRILKHTVFGYFPLTL